MAGTTVFAPATTTTDAGLDQNPEEIGRASVLMLLSQMRDNALGIPEVPRQVLVQGRWVDGKSMPKRSK